MAQQQPAKNQHQLHAQLRDGQDNQPHSGNPWLTVRRLSVAVLLDYAENVGDDGQVTRARLSRRSWMKFAPWSQRPSVSRLIVVIR